MFIVLKSIVKTILTWFSARSSICAVFSIMLTGICFAFLYSCSTPIKSLLSPHIFYWTMSYLSSDSYS